MVVLTKKNGLGNEGGVRGVGAGRACGLWVLGTYWEGASFGVQFCLWWFFPS